MPPILSLLALMLGCTAPMPDAGSAATSHAERGPVPSRERYQGALNCAASVWVIVNRARGSMTADEQTSLDAMALYNIQGVTAGIAVESARHAGVNQDMAFDHVVALRNQIQGDPTITPSRVEEVCNGFVEFEFTPHHERWAD